MIKLFRSVSQIAIERLRRYGRRQLQQFAARFVDHRELI
jgi:hypothetical protein